ncbi:MAG: radical SAM protein [Candidatus Omnitrophota bacterium]
MNQIDNRLAQIQSRWDELIGCVHDPALFEGLAADLAKRWFAYFFTLPNRPEKRPSLRSHVLALYDPFAPRSVFPAGIRFSCNTYVGCALQCAYCYIQTYFENPLIAPHAKQKFAERLEKDFRELEELNLPAIPLHFSNSTDALQETLEKRHQNTFYLLQRLAQGEHRRFQPIRMLTRNPALLLRREYLDLLLEIKNKVTVQVSIPILDPNAGHFYEPNVPSSSMRLQAIYKLRSQGIPISFRIDPLFPRDPLPKEIFGETALTGFDVLPAQTEMDLRYLVQAAAQCGCQSIVISALKIPRNLSSRNQRLMKGWLAFYQSLAAAHPKLNSRNYLRLPHEYQHGELVYPILDEAERWGIIVEHCKNNLIHAR